MEEVSDVLTREEGVVVVVEVLRVEDPTVMLIREVNGRSWRRSPLEPT